MRLFISKNKKWFGYLLFALILTLALLYYRFPSDAIRCYLQAEVERANPRLVLSVNRIEPRLPVGLKFIGTELVLKDEPDKAILRSDSLLLKPHVWSLLRGKSEYSFHCLAYRGEVGGSVYFEKDRTRGSIDTEIELRDIYIGDYAYLFQLIGHSIEGTLGGTLSYKGQYKSLMDASGQANLRLSHGRVVFLRPFLMLEGVDFDEIEIEMVLKKQEIDLTRLELKGRQLNGTLSGTITLKEVLAESSLDLRGTIEPLAEFFKSTGGILDTVDFFGQGLNRGMISFVIQGTLMDPRMKST